VVQHCGLGESGTALRAGREGCGCTTAGLNNAAALLGLCLEDSEKAGWKKWYISITTQQAGSEGRGCTTALLALSEGCAAGISS
jgi:hypothetical protein